MRGLMKKLIIIPILAVLVSCGGGGTTSPELQSLQSFTTPPVSGSSSIYGTKVIDGYVEGANVFVDFNYNLTQDEGEPSGTFNSDTNEYEFLDSEFSAINNWTVNCGLNRPRVAEVPVGAYDSTRGYVNDAYTMLYFPHDSDGTGKANVTPFTTMLLASINALLPSAITVADGCGTVANETAESVKQDVNNFLYNLEVNFSINRNYFYDDFIASGDTTQQAIGEKVVDFLTTLHKIESLLEQEYNMGFRGLLTDEIINKILNNQAFSDVTYDIQNETVSTQEDTHFRYNRRHNFNGVRGNSLGQILDSDSLPIELTMANLEANSTVLISENYEENASPTIISGIRVHISIEQRKGDYAYEKTFVRFIGPYSVELALRNSDRRVIMSGKNASTSDFELRIRSSNNPYFTDNIVNLMSTRNTSDIVQLYNDITTIDMSMSGSQSNVYLLYANDFNLYEGGNSSIGNWMFRQQMVGGSLYEECTHRDWETRTQLEQTTGTEAYNRCSEVL